MEQPYTPVRLSGPDRVRLILALNRAVIQPFGRAEWGAFAGATGDAHSVYFSAQDEDYFLKALRITHWDPLTTVVVLDEVGVTWNGCPPCNSYAYQVQVTFDVDIHEPGSPREYWEVGFRGMQGWALEMRDLPEHVRSVVLACPEEARPYVLQGYRQAQHRPPALQVYSPGAELAHRQPGGQAPAAPAQGVPR